jgi:hypothetical protein
MNALKASATLWFIVAAAGQWLFACYVVVVFGTRVVADSGRSAAEALLDESSWRPCSS